MDSLQNGRRTANTNFREIKAGMRDDGVVLKRPNRGKERCSLSIRDCGAGAVRHHADQARSGFNPIEVIVRRLGGRRP